MASKQYEMASAYVSILPSLEGLSKELKDQLNSATPQLKKNMDRVFSKTFSGAGKGLSAAFKINDRMFSTIGRGLGNVLSSSVRGAGRTFKEVMTVGAKSAGVALSATLATVGGKVAAGGLTRALGINEAEARLKALGFSAAELEEVMTAASNAIDGTSYKRNESVTAATQFIAAGITEGRALEAVLKNTAKLADMAPERSFADMGSIMAKNAAAGIVQWEDLNQLVDAGIPIQVHLAEMMGKTTQEIKKMASAGEITFDDLNRAVDGIEFDSALYAAESVPLAFKNVGSQLEKIGETLWNPIIDNLAPILVRVRQGLIDFQDMPAFEAFTEKIAEKSLKMMEKVSEAVEKFFSIFENASDKDTLGSFGSKINDFKEKIKGLEGVLAGVGIALGSSFLSSIPVIGGLFGSISLGAGALGGGLAQVYASSEPLRKSVSNLIEAFKNLLGTFTGFNAEGIAENVGLKLSGIVDSITGFISGLDLSRVNIDFSGIFNSIFGNFEDFITTIFDSGDRISASIGKVIDTITSSFSGISGDQSFGEWLGDTVVDAIDFATNIVDVAAPIISGAISALSNVITSDFTAGLFGALTDFAEWLSGKEVLLLMLGGTLSALFIVGKLSKPLIGMVKFFKMFKKEKVLDEAAGGKAGSGITAFIKEIGNAGLALLKSTPKIVAGIGGITLIAGAITVALKVFDTLGGFDALQETLGKIYGILEEFAAFLGRVFLTIVDAITAGLSAIADALGLSDMDIMPFIEQLGERFSEVVKLIGDTVEVIATTITEGIDALSNLISTLITDFSDFISVLAEDGWAAGEAAWFLAGGLAALGGALVVFGGGSLIGDFLSGLGSLGNKFVSLFTGDEEGSVAKLSEMAESFGQISEVINDLPENWAEMAPQAAEAGFKVIQSFGEGMLNGLNSLTTQMISEVNNMITNLQAQINSRPLNFRLNAANVGASFGSGGIINNTNNKNFDVRVNSDSALKSLARSAR